jgi:hypothetical protein
MKAILFSVVEVKNSSSRSADLTQVLYKHDHGYNNTDCIVSRTESGRNGIVMCRAIDFE